MTSVRHYRAGALADALALVEGSRRASETRLAPGVQAWLASPEQGLQSAIESVSGAQATADALARLAPSRLSVLSEIRLRTACWAEVARWGDGEPETCLAGTSIDASGQVSRLLWLRASLVPAAGLDSGRAAADARPVLERYFADLMSSRFAEAAAHFTVDTIYSHPPYAGGVTRVLYEGREALWRGLVEERGPSPVRQVITDLWQQGDRVFMEGVVEGIPNGGTFFSTAEISPEGALARYVAFYSAARVPSL